MLKGMNQDASTHNEEAWRTVCRGVRGATVAAEDSADAILAATRELLCSMIYHNQIHADDVASVYFTTTADLTACYPAIAARQLGWYDVPLMCGHEMQVPNGLPKAVRILLHWNTTRTPQEIVHVYLHEAAALRPDKEHVPQIPLEELENLLAAQGIEVRG